MGLLGRPFSTVRLFENAFVVAGETAFAGWALLGADTFHFQAATDGARARKRMRGGEI